jgi:hypothetical protein
MNGAFGTLKTFFAYKSKMIEGKKFILINPEYKDYRIITVKFKQEGQGLICLMHWMSSNYYKEYS